MPVAAPNAAVSQIVILAGAPLTEATSPTRSNASTTPEPSARNPNAPAIPKRIAPTTAAVVGPNLVRSQDSDGPSQL